MPLSLEDIIKKALTNPDTGPKKPDLSKGFRGGANFPATTAALGMAALSGDAVTETPEGAYAVTKPEGGGDGRTLGDVVTVDPRLDPAVQESVFTHELGHVDQGKLAPGALPALAAVDQIQNLIRGGEHQNALFEGGLDDPFKRGQSIQQQSLEETLSQAREAEVFGKSNPFDALASIVSALRGR